MSRKESSGTSRQMRLGLGAALGVVVVVVLAVVLGILADRYKVRLDYSQSGRFSLAPQTVEMLEGLEKPVQAVAFYQFGQHGSDEVKELLQRYAAESDKFTFQMIDPDRNPALAEKYNVRKLGHGSVFVTMDGRTELCRRPDEESLTHAIMRLSGLDKKIVYFLTGHGERSLSGMGREGLSELAGYLKEQNYQAEPLLLAQSGRVPGDAAAVVVAGPQRTVPEAELGALLAYIKGGGGVMVMLDPATEAGMGPWLKALGVIVGNDFVFDPASQLPGALMAVDYLGHQITDPLIGVGTVFLQARSVTPQEFPPSGVQVTSLVFSVPGAWGETDLQDVISPKKDQGMDLDGPVSLAVAAKINGHRPENAPQDQPVPQGRLVVTGDSDLAANFFLSQPNNGNRDLVLNTINFLAGDESLISLRPRYKTLSPLQLKPDEASFIFWVPVVAWPLLFACMGLFIVLMRRRGRK